MVRLNQVAAAAALFSPVNVRASILARQLPADPPSDCTEPCQAMDDFLAANQDCFLTGACSCSTDFANLYGHCIKCINDATPSTASPLTPEDYAKQYLDTCKDDPTTLSIPHTLGSASKTIVSTSTPVSVTRSGSASGSPASTTSKQVTGSSNTGSRTTTSNAAGATSTPSSSSESTTARSMLVALIATAVGVIAFL